LARGLPKPRANRDSFAHMPDHEPVDDLTMLQWRAARLRAAADALSATYNRTTWIRFVGVFFPVPFVVVLFRLSLDAWAYYLAGTLIILSGAVLYVVDGAASAKVDRAVAAAERAQQAYDAARAAAVRQP
jgi:hypothetical protein